MLRRILAVEKVIVVSRIVVITGGSSGIGRALGAALVARGDDAVLAARTEADVQRTAGELSAQSPGKARGAVLDARNADKVAGLVNDVYDSQGRLDLMINNAGICVIGFVHELTPGYWERIYDTMSATRVPGEPFPPAGQAESPAQRTGPGGEPSLYLARRRADGLRP